MSSCVADVLESFQVADVTNDTERLEQAFDILVDGYLPLASRQLNPQQVRDDVCYDAYHRYGLARTLLLTGWNPTSERHEALGTLRITLGSGSTAQLGLRPLEAMDLMRPTCGWRQFRFRGFRIDDVAEGGRTAVAQSCRVGPAKEIGLSRHVLAELFRAGAEIARRNFGRRQYWGILPDYMVRCLEPFAIRAEFAAEPFDRRSTHEGLFATFDRYWMQNVPRFCRVYA